MKVCDNGHDPIAYNGNHGCPLCSLMIHINIVHDFIESKGEEFVKELVKYQGSQNKKEEE